MENSPLLSVYHSNSSIFVSMEIPAFEVDVYNLADGTVVGQDAYKLGNTVCVIKMQISGYDMDDPDYEIPENPGQDIEILCGEMSM